MKTPVAFLVFNRPIETAKVFEEIRRAKPPILLIVADGPRNEKEKLLCDEVRKTIEDLIDWPCEVHREYAQKNMGCKKRIASGLDWVFSMVERAIILEDDCVPHPTFFRFCEELLEKYADDPRVMHISGSSFHHDNPDFSKEYSYYCSIYQNQIGWASWRRAWKLYDPDIKSWHELKRTRALIPRFRNIKAYERFANVWDRYYRHEIDSWDSQWGYACIAHDGIALNPTRNLITNIGATSGTHFNPNKIYPFCDLPLEAMPFPLKHPPALDIDRASDAYYAKVDLGSPDTLLKKIPPMIRIYLSGPYALYRKLKGF